MEVSTTNKDKKVTGGSCNFCQEEKLDISIYTDNCEGLNKTLEIMAKRMEV